MLAQRLMSRVRVRPALQEFVAWEQRQPIGMIFQSQPEIVAHAQHVKTIDFVFLRDSRVKRTKRRKIGTKQRVEFD